MEKRTQEYNWNQNWRMKDKLVVDPVYRSSEKQQQQTTFFFFNKVPFSLTIVKINPESFHTFDLNEDDTGCN